MIVGVVNEYREAIIRLQIINGGNVFINMLPEQKLPT